MSFNNVNPYCLDSLVQLSEQRTVLAADDIFDDNGMKLWARGKPVSRDLQEKLLRRKLKKPLETTLEVENALSFNDIVADVRAIIDEKPLIARVAGRGALSVLGSLKNFPIPPALRLLLTSAQVNNSRTYHHTLMTVLVSAGIAARLGASDHDAQLLMVAALLHDVGEMYVNPDYLKSAHRLQPSEWKHVASHPRISQMLIQEMTPLPAAVAQIVGQHHERFDGSGYPDQLARDRQHKLSGWLAVADTASAILARGDGGAPLRVALALRVVPEEFDRDAVSALLLALKNGGDTYGESPDCLCIKRANAMAGRVDAAMAAAALAKTAASQAFAREIALATLGVLGNLDKSLRATGVIAAAQFGDLGDDAELMAEICLIVKETGWRMRNLARNIHLRAEKHASGLQLEELLPLIASLDEGELPVPACAG